MTDQDITVSPFAIPNALLRRRRLIALVTMLGAAGGVVVALLQVPRFEATARFITAPTGTVEGVGSDLGPVQERDPFDYYASVLVSTPVLDAVLASPHSSGGAISAHLGAPPSVDAGALRRRLAPAVRLDSTRRGGAAAMSVLMVRVTWTDAAMAAELANAFMAALKEYDKNIRTYAARERKTFVEDQLKTTQKAMDDAEDALRSFMEQNRMLLGGTGSTVTTPPQVTLKVAQLQRDVDVQKDLYLGIRRAFDQVSIAAVDEASAIIVVEPASPPTSRTGVARRVLVAAGAGLGCVLGIALAGVLEVRHRLDLSSPDAREFVDHLDTIRRQWSRYLRPPTTVSSDSPTPKEPPHA